METCTGLECDKGDAAKEKEEKYEEHGVLRVGIDGKRDLGRIDRITKSR